MGRARKLVKKALKESGDRGALETPPFPTNQLHKRPRCDRPADSKFHTIVARFLQFW